MLLCPCLLLISLSCQVLSCIFHLNSFRLGSLGVHRWGSSGSGEDLQSQRAISNQALRQSLFLWGFIIQPSLIFRQKKFKSNYTITTGLVKTVKRSFLKSLYFPYLSFTLNETQGVNLPTQHLVCSTSKFKRQFDAC